MILRKANLISFSFGNSSILMLILILTRSPRHGFHAELLRARTRHRMATRPTEIVIYVERSI